MLSILTFVATVLVLSPATSAQGDSCTACNCQFDNINLLIDLIRAEVRDTYARWTPVNKTQIGRRAINTITALSFNIPSVIPDNAQAVLVYSTARCGYTGNIDMGVDISYYVVVDGTRYEHFLKMHAYPQRAYNTNSDNMWFPMPSNRLVYVKLPTALPGNCDTTVSVIGYR